MPGHSLRIATRKSALARWQAHHVGARLKALYPKLSIEYVEMTTRGDTIVNRPLTDVGGKALFVKELEQGLLEERADIAVHSLKDVPMELPAGLVLPVALAREDPRDAVISRNGAPLAELPPKARIGTCSLRRGSQLAARFPTLTLVPLRGNVDTRLAKLDAGEFEAIILATAGLKRLGLAERITEQLAPEVCLPAIGQGVIAIECRADDSATQALIAGLNDPATEAVISAERAMNFHLQGSCHVPIGGYARLNAADEQTALPQRELWLRGLVGEPDGSRIISGEVRGLCREAAQLGQRLAEQLLAEGADAILAKLRDVDASGDPAPSS